MNESSAAVTSVELDARQLQAAVMLASGSLAKNVAAELKVTPQTISAWRTQPDFQEIVTQLKTDYLLAARDTVRALALDAVIELERLMKHSRSDHVRLRAALAILSGIGAIDQPYTNAMLWRRLGSI